MNVFVRVSRVNRKSAWNLGLLVLFILIWSKALVNIFLGLSDEQTPVGTHVLENNYRELLRQENSERLDFRYATLHRDPFLITPVQEPVKPEPVTHRIKRVLPPPFKTTGIIFQPLHPVAIMTDQVGRSHFVNPGDTLDIYLVQQISRDTVILVSPDASQHKLAITQ